MRISKIKKIINLFLIMSIILFYVPAIPSFAETSQTENVVFVSDLGSDDNSGKTPDSAFKSLIRAYQTLGDEGGTIVVSGSFGFTPFTEPKHTGEVTITQVYNGIDYRIDPENPDGEGHAFYTKTAGRFILNGPTRFENIHIKAGEGSYLLIVAQANPITMAEGVTCTGFANNRVDRSVTIVGGFQNGSGSNFPGEFNTSITIESGSFIIAGFNRQISSTHTGTATINISGGEIVTLYGGSLNSGRGGNVELTITGGKFTGMIYAGGNSDPVWTKGDVSVKITGGDFTSCTGIDGAVIDGISYLDISEIEDGWETLVEKAVNFNIIRTPDGEISDGTIIEPNDVFRQGSFIDSQGTVLPYRYYLPETYNPNKRYPLLLYLHGLGSRGDDNTTQLTSSGAAVVKKIINGVYKEDIIILAPQCPAGEQWVASGKYPGSSEYDPQEPMSTYLSAAWELMHKTISDYNIDRSRIYATGSSNGGGAVWSLAARNPEFFAAIIPLAGTGETGGAATIAESLASTPIWTFHGDADEILSVEGTRQLVAAISEVGGNIIYTELPGVNHGGCWPAAAKQEGLLDWMYNQFRTIEGEETDGVVYVSQSGNDGNSGTESNPVKTLEAAYNILGISGGTIVICDRYELSETFKEPIHNGTVIITTNDGNTDYSAFGAALVFSDGVEYLLNGATTFKDITISYTGMIYFVANFNPIVFDTGITTVSDDIDTPNIYVIGGHHAPQSSDNVPLNLDSYITIKSGTLYKVVCGFTRNRGSATLTYTGMSHITVEGGIIETIYGASIANHYSGSTVINIKGGTIGTIYAAGDVTRRLNGTADIIISNGTVNTVNVNNVVGNATLTLDGGTLENATVSYGNSTVEALCASSIVTLRYNTLSYTESQAAVLGEKFDFIIPYGSVYVKNGATGDGKSETSPTHSLDVALSLIGESGGTVEVLGEYTLPADYTEPTHTSEITISGYDENSKLIFPQDSKYTLSGLLNIKDIVIQNDGKLVIDANNNNLTIGEGCTIMNPLNMSVMGGTSADGFTNITITGSSIGNVYVHACNTEDEVFSGNGLVTILDGHVENIYTLGGTVTSSGKEIIQVLGGSVVNISFYNSLGDIELRLLSGSVNNIDVSYTDEATEARATGESSLYYNNRKYSNEQVSAVSHLFDKVSGAKVVFVADDGNGDGSSSYTPVGSLTEAVQILGDEGGVIVPCGSVTVDETFYLPSYSNLITFTSIFGGVDYSEVSNARLLMGGSIFLGGPTIFTDIVIEQTVDNCSIYCNGFDTVFDTGIRSEKRLGVSNYISVDGGGYNATTINDQYTLTINSGRYNVVRGGHAGVNSIQTASSTSVVINGGEFYSYFCATGDGIVEGDATLVINDGEFFAGVYGSGDNGTSYNGRLDLTINGGIFHSAIAPAASRTTELKGHYNLTINGGDFKSVTEIKGTNEIAEGMESEISIDEGIDIYKEETGEITFTNYLRPGADPWVIYHDGYYYMTITGGTQVRVFKAVNLNDLATAPPVPVFIPEPGHMYSRNLWSPEIHYLPAEDFGEEHEGWYMFIACDDGDNNNHRMYVLKSLSGDPMGPYGHPVTGEANVPILVTSKDDPTVNTEWCAGQTILRHNDEIYTLWVGEIWENLSDTETRRYQVEYISRMENPWTMVGEKAIICMPTEDWEKNGSTTSGNKIYPEVVEGGTAVYGPNGEVYVIYSGSGYWTVHYQLGQLKLIGDDPLAYDNWEKTTTPIFSKSDEVNGCGHASYTVSPDGETRWIVYHAYTGRDTQSGRFVFVEPYTVDSEKVVIGNGSGHPQPINTEMTIKVNPMPLAKKLIGWGNSLPTVTSIEIKGVDNISVDSGSAATVNFEVEVKDQNGSVMQNETVDWIVYDDEGNTPSGLSINDNGVLTIEEDAVEGIYTIKAVSTTNPSVTGVKNLTIKIEEPTDPGDDDDDEEPTDPGDGDDDDEDDEEPTDPGDGDDDDDDDDNTADQGESSDDDEDEDLTDPSDENEEDPALLGIDALSYVDNRVEVTLTEERNKLSSDAEEKLAEENKDKDIIIAGNNVRLIIQKGSLSAGDSINNMIVDTSKITDSKTQVVQYTDEEGNTHIVKFSMVNKELASYIAMKPGIYEIIDNSKNAEDIDGHWAVDSIDFVMAHEIFKGVNDTDFDPDGNMTRAMFVTVLGRLHDIMEKDMDSNIFNDVEEGVWYTDYVTWAYENGIAKGNGRGSFCPDNYITREELCTMLYRYIKFAGIELEMLPESETTTFRDNDAISSWAQEAASIMQRTNLIKGKPGNIFDPKGKATRAEVATILYRLIESVMK